MNDLKTMNSQQMAPARQANDADQQTMEQIFWDLIRYGWPCIYKHRRFGWRADQVLNIMEGGHPIRVKCSGQTAREALEDLQKKVHVAAGVPGAQP